MDSATNYLIPGLALLVVCGLIGGSFWGGYQVARRIVQQPAAIILLTLVFGSIITAAVAGGLVAGCFAMVGGQSFR